MVRPTSVKTHGDDYEEFGRKLAKAREAKGLSQKEASQQLGIPQSTYAGYETGTRKIPLSLIKELSRFYEVSTDLLLGDYETDIITLAAHKPGGYDEPLTDDEDAAVKAFLETYRKMKQNKEE
jgi:transcriptional regulator with XRE-family HTH domain